MGTQGTMTSPGRGTQRNWLVVSWPSPARTLTDSWKVRGQVAFESSDRFNAPPPPSHLTTFDLDAPWLARSFFSHCIRQRSYPLRSESSFKSRPILFSPLRASPHSPSRSPSLWERWRTSDPFLSLSLSLINVSLRSLSVNDKRWKFFYFFLFFSFSRKHDSRTRRPLSGRGKREALLSRPVFLANAPKLEGGKGWKYPLPR